MRELPVLKTHTCQVSKHALVPTLPSRPSAVHRGLLDKTQAAQLIGGLGGVAANSDVRSNTAKAALNCGPRRVYSRAECTDAHWELHMSKHINRHPKVTFRSRPCCGVSHGSYCSDAAGGLRLFFLLLCRSSSGGEKGLHPTF